MALEDLMRYESAGVAAMHAGKEPGLAIAAMANFYRNALKEEDPIISRALQEATAGGEKGISHAGVVDAIKVYGSGGEEPGKYDIAFATTKFSDLVKYLTADYKIPNEAQEALSRYDEYTFIDLAEKLEAGHISDEDKKEISKAVKAINLLRNRKLRARTSDIVDENTFIDLKSLYPPIPER